jgi:type VI secretion system protein ImpL
MLSPYWPYLLLALVLLVLGIALFLYFVLRRARRRAAAEAMALAPSTTGAGVPEPAPYVSASSLGLRSSFSRAVRLLRTHVTRRDYRYRLPWFLMIGESQSGKTTALAGTGLGLPLGRPVAQSQGVREGLNWFFFDRGVVLDVAGDFVLRPDGEPSNSRGWNQIARLLQKHRPERPIDGLILTIPCTDLVGVGGGPGFERRAKIEQKAACLYRKLWQAQKLLGMSFPVYVLVTKCDELAGFRSLCRELPATLREEMFGWSSPYTLETAYRPEWIEEAFQTLHRYLFQIQVEVFAEKGEVHDRDGLFMLPSEMQALKAPLQLYLDQVFKESSFHDSFFFRGLYFCGDAGDAEQPQLQPTTPQASQPGWAFVGTEDSMEAARDLPALPSAQPGMHKPAFLKDLFEKKIFLEDMLARPVVKTTLSRNRTVFAAQVLSLAIPIIGCVGLLTTYAGLERRRDEIYDLLVHEEQDLREVRELEGQRGVAPRVADFYTDYGQQPDAARPVYSQPARTLPSALPREAAYDRLAAGPYTAPALADDPAPTPAVSSMADNEEHLLAGMAKLGGRSYHSVFIPSSWFSDLNERIGNSLVVAFQYVILDDLRLALEDRTNTFLQAAPIYGYATGAYAEPGLVPRGVAGGAGGAIDTRGVAGGAGGAIDARGLAPVYDQPFAVNADATLHGFVERFGELRENRARYESLIALGSGSLEDLKALSEYLGHRWPREGFDVNNEHYKRALEQARGESLSPRDAEVQRAFASKVAEMVELLYQRSFEVRTGAVRYDYLNDIAQTEALLARPEFTWLSTYVFDARSSFHDMTLSSGLDELRKALDALQRESFMAQGAANSAARTPAFLRRQLIWDAEPLRQALALCNDYERFAGGRGGYSKNLDDSVRQSALAQLRANVVGLVARAQRFETAPRTPGESAMRVSLDAEVKSFQQSQELLTQLLDSTTRLGVDVGLRAAISNQAVYLVGAVNREFEAGQFYATARPDFSWWGGGKPISYPAFDADSPEELAGYLAVQRKRIAFLARELAAPVLSFMAAQNISAQQLRAGSRVDWDEILTELDRYDNKQPGNSVAALEEFIRFGMDKASIEDCDELVRAAPDGVSRDFFIQTRNHLRRLLYRQCAELARQKSYNDSLRAMDDNLRALDSYREVADAFNRTLAGRFPFADASGGVPLAEADPEAVLAFFRLLDKREPAAREALNRNPQLGTAREEALAFLDRADAARVFFASYLDKKLGPFVDFNLQFRVNENMEAGGNQIIDWTLDVGRKKYRYLDQELSGRWVIGEPVRLTLRWANNSPSVPFSPDDSSTLRVRDRVAVFEFRNRWSLLALMSRQAATQSDFKYGVDTDVYTLKFQIPTRPGDNLPERQPDALRTEMAEVFMRLSFVAPGSKEPLLLPAFPARAPKI